ncbi:MAG: hypothetical protein KGJ62_09325 [Armatimonadetes bacterium]|nr:hypothetical protein [Armatimonadota bacterium]MDE2207445.1 hypothetical protein [Armatimonadota bacterium]
MTEQTGHSNRSDRTSLPTRCMVAAAAGALLSLAFPPYRFVFVIPLALAVFIAVLEEASPREGFITGICFGYPWSAITLFWLTRLFGSASISLWAIAACWPALFGAALAWCSSRRARIPAWLAAPALCVALEVLREQVVWPRTSVGGIAYAALGGAPLWPIAAVAGSYGVSFLLVMLATQIARTRFRPRIGIAALASWGAVCLLPRSPMRPEHPVVIRLVQAQSEDDSVHFALSTVPARRRLDAILWSEYSFMSDPRWNPKLWQKLRALAADQHALFVFGARDVPNRSTDAYFNAAFVIGSNGTVLGVHHKNHPVPMFRDGTPGRDARVFPAAFGRVGVAICYDLDSPDVSLRLARNGAQLLLAPSDNPARWGPVQNAQQRQILRMRSAETGLWLAAADTAGSTFACDSHGASVARVVTAGPTMIDVPVAMAHRTTIFVRGGWMFGWLCLVSALVAIAAPGDRKQVA